MERRAQIPKPPPDPPRAPTRKPNGEPPEEPEKVPPAPPEKPPYEIPPEPPPPPSGARRGRGGASAGQIQSGMTTAIAAGAGYHAPTTTLVAARPVRRGPCALAWPRDF